MPQSKSVSLYQRILAASIVAPLLAWIAFLWEQFTGMTFVLSRNYAEMGRPSTTLHLHRSLFLAIAVTVLAIPIGWYCRAALRQERIEG